MDSGVKGRTTLWLRAERAMGLESVPVVIEDQASPRTGSTIPVGPVVVERTVMAGPKKTSSIAPVKPASPVAAAPVAPTTVASAPVKASPVIAKGGSNLFGRSVSSVAPSPGIERPAPGLFTSMVLSTDLKRVELDQLDANYVKGCTRCRLCETRTNTVFGEGDVDAKVMFIGEGPGENEDQTGRPFVGRAGILLGNMIVGMGLSREQVYIANIVKCRPPDNRVPAPDESDTCMSYLERQIELVRPRVLVTLGLSATKYLLNQPKLTMGKTRGLWMEWRGIKVMPTWHPSYVLRVYTPEVRRMVWDDLQLVMQELGLKPKGS